MKHIKIISFILIPILFSSCEKRVHISEFEQNRYGHLKGPYFYDKEIDQDRLMLKGEYFTGTVFDNYSEDKLKFEFQFKNGLRYGVTKTYFDNGQLEKIINFKEGIKDGLYEEYYENGQLRIKRGYKDGKLDGLYEEYYENGQLLGKSNVKDNEKDGPYEEYYENGQLTIKCNYKKGKEDGPYEEYFDNGQLRIKCNYRDGKKDGVCEFYKDGKLYKKGMFENGRLVGDYEYNLINVDVEEMNKVNSNEERDDNNSTNSINNTPNIPGKYPQSSTTQLNPDDLTNMSKDELQIMRNEIFGRHGYIFKEGGKMNEYFSKQSWYNPQFSDVDSKLTPIEKSNIELILNEEKNR